MASTVNAALCALVATAFCTALGYALSRHILPRVLALGAAPVVGWAIFSAATLPIVTLVGFSPPAVAGTAALFLLIGGGALMMQSANDDAGSEATIPIWGYAAAAVLALAPASAIVPKVSGDGVRLGVQFAAPIFDHAKVAIIDAMTRQGLPPVNPVFGQFGAPSRLSYYYLWHFSAAELALPLHISGWEADIGLTWFTAFASLTLMMGVAVWLSKRSDAAILVVALAAGASLRTTLSFFFGNFALEPFMASPSGFAGWLFQSAWVPQHLMAASCVVAAMVLIVHYAQRPSWARLVTLALLVVAGFESSAYVGGLTFAAAALVAAPIVFAAVHPARRFVVAGGLAGAAVLALLIAAPFIRDQLATIAARGGTPVVIDHFAVLGTLFPQTLRRVLDAPAYWLILLPIEFPATFIAGVIALAVTRRGLAAGPEKTAVAIFIALAGAGLVISWLLVSTLGDVNDLGLRAVLPAAMVLIVAAAAAMMRAERRALIVATAIGGLALSLPDSVAMIRYNIVGSPAADAQIFAKSPELWAAVRRYAGPAARVANNPLFVADLLPWPANMSWALLANRSSCFAGREMALAFAPLPPDRREAINAQFIRVFAGQGTAADVEDLAKKFACDVVVVVPQDGAWTNDPFASSPDYRLGEARDGKWRIYVRTGGRR